MQRQLLGSWTGTLQGNGMALRLLVEFREEEGMLRGSLTSLDQSAERLPLSRIEVSAERVAFAVVGGRGAFTGTLQEATTASGGERLDGTWSQGPFRGALVLTRTSRSRAALLAGECRTEGSGATVRLHGTWRAGLRTSTGATLPLRLEIAPCNGEAQAGQLDARVVSESQGATIPVTRLRLHGEDEVRFSLEPIGAEFTGRLTEGEIAGEWHQSGQSAPLTWRRPALARPQEQASLTDRPYEVAEVQFRSADGMVTLAGTLTTPPGPTRAGLVLVTGSGPQDRDETIGGHRPFLVLADHLSRHGYTVLRYDDRGVGASDGDFPSSTVDDHLADLKGAVAWLADRVNGDVGILGHSLGGTLAALAARAKPQAVRFLVLVAAPAVDGVALMTEQTRAVAASGGAAAEAAAQLAAFNRELYRALVAGGSDDERAERVRARLRQVTEDPDSPLKPFLPGDIDALTARLLSPRFRFILEHVPANTLEDLPQPVLALYGERDVQVSAALNVPAMRRLLATTGRGSEVRSLEALNHLMQEASSGNPAEYANLEQTVSPRALDAVTDWLGRLGY